MELLEDSKPSLLSSSTEEERSLFLMVTDLENMQWKILWDSLSLPARNWAAPLRAQTLLSESFVVHKYKAAATTQGKQP